MTIFAEQYDFAISLLLLEDQVGFYIQAAEEEPDVFERMSATPPRREW
jgi:hypothetical protein